MPSVNQAFEEDFSVPANQQQRQEQDAEPSSPFPRSEKESSGRENSVAKIRVVVRKRPLNKKETAKKEDDIITVSNNSLTVHEIKLKVRVCATLKDNMTSMIQFNEMKGHRPSSFYVDLTAYMEKHEFCFDAVLGEHVSNDEVYRVTIEPIIPTIFQRTKATCFAYGQTDLMRMLSQPVYRDQRLKLWLSYFEIYGGKLYDLLSERNWLTNKLLLSRKLCMREDGRQQVCIVGLQEFEVSDIQIVKDYIDKGSASRSTGSTGANEESSRSHAILQLVVKKHVEVKETRRNNNDNNESRGKVVGKISFIDLAGSERGADTTDNDRQTRIEGAEINKSLLALKECIRALDNDQLHIPFRGSKLTEVLRDSFVGNSRTVMISCISPNEGSCEHTLNTLRYADRVTSLSKSGNSKKDQTYNSLPPANKDASLASSQLASNDAEDWNSFGGGSTSQRIQSSSYSQDASDQEEKVKKVSPTRRKVPREEKPERYLNLSKRDSISASDVPATINFRQLNSTTASRNTNDGSSRQYETITEPPSPDENISALLEEEEALITAHRKEIEDTMEIVREEMKLLAEVDRPGSMIDNYVTQLNFALSRKAAGLVSLQARLARFQHRLKEQEILSRKRIGKTNDIRSTEDAIVPASISAVVPASISAVVPASISAVAPASISSLFPHFCRSLNHLQKVFLERHPCSTRLGSLVSRTVLQTLTLSSVGHLNSKGTSKESRVNLP
ncbi:hypothetical protein YC2023_076134 [Brassica napus]